MLAVAYHLLITGFRLHLSHFGDGLSLIASLFIAYRLSLTACRLLVVGYRSSIVGRRPLLAACRLLVLGYRLSRIAWSRIAYRLSLTALRLSLTR